MLKRCRVPELASSPAVRRAVQGTDRKAPHPHSPCVGSGQPVDFVTSSSTPWAVTGEASGHRLPEAAHRDLLRALSGPFRDETGEDDLKCDDRPADQNAAANFCRCRQAGNREQPWNSP